MSKDNPRSYRVADQIQKDLAQLIRNEVKDPRLSPFVTIEEVRVTRDLSVAKIYFTTLDDKGPESEEVLNRAAGFLRSALGKLIRMRSVPQLRFVHDTTSQEAQQLSSVIDKAVAADQSRHQEDESEQE